MADTNPPPTDPIPAPRTRLLVIDAPKGADPTIKVHRQQAVLVDGQAFERPTRIISRRYSAVATATATLASGKTITVAEIAEAISLLGDAWEQQEPA